MKSVFEKLRQQQYNAILHAKEYKALLREMGQRIVTKSLSAPNEATVESYFDCELFALFREVFSPLGFEYNPVKEAAVATKRQITKGRADSLLGALVIEYK